MRILVRTFAMVVPLMAIVVGLFAESYTIAVSVDKNGKISYDHSKNSSGKSHGAKGHQVVVVGDTITWACASAPCQKVAVQFKNDNPCATQTPIYTSCTAGNYFGVFPYSIAVLNAAGDVLGIHDPDIIVDNGGQDERPKAAPKKK